MEVLTRKEAKVKGLKKYFTGKLCKYGHVAIRTTQSGKCSDCNKLQCIKYKNSNNEKEIKRWRAYKQLHKEDGNSNKALRRARIKKALPKWANLEKIREIYKNCPKGYHVDHIVPLVSTQVCGLHVPENLQYLTVRDNLKKGNKHEA